MQTTFLKGKTAVITGGAGGIGEAFSRTLAKAGARVIIICRNETKGNLLVEEIKKQGGSATCFKADLADYKAPSLKQFLNEENKVDILVNNAGISGFMGEVSLTPIDEFVDVLNINLVSAFALSQMVLPHMQSAKYGRIINISSIAPRINPARTTTYNISKAGLNSFTKSLSREVASYGITVNAIAPGLVLTDRIKTKRIPGLVKETGKSPEELIGEMACRNDTKSLSTEQELADLLLFLCSPSARNMTGEILELSGGYA